MIESLMSTLIKNTALCCMLLSALSTQMSWAQSLPSVQTIDPQLVGEWEGEFKPVDEPACTAYKWHMMRKNDGSYQFRAYDATQTVLNDEGHWWVDVDHGLYFENVNGQAEEPTTYRYILSQNNLNGSTVEAEYTLTQPLAAGECSQTAHFNETKLIKEAS